MKLNIADKLKLPVEAVTQTFAILAKRGAGKTYLASVMAEEMLEAREQIVALDPTGAWWGLRSGYPIVVLGGDHGHIPLEENAGELIASAIVQNRFSAVLDLSAFRKGQMIRFMVAFAETLYRLNRHPLHLFVDEADAVAPQGRQFGGEENRMLGAMEDIVRRGRKRGIGCTLITQRPAVLNKNVLTQCESLFALRLTHPRDIGAVMEWINVHADPDEAETVVKSLPTLSIGDAWLWSPGWLGILERIHVRERKTFDSGATPKPGERVRPPKEMVQIDLTALGDQMKAAAESAKANDPKELKRRVAELEKQLRKAPCAAPAQKMSLAEDQRSIRTLRTALEDALKFLIKIEAQDFISKTGEPIDKDKLEGAIRAAVEGAIKLIEDKLRRRNSELEKWQKEGSRLLRSIKGALGEEKMQVDVQVKHNEPFTVQPAPKPRAQASQNGDAQLGSGGDRRMLIALAQHPEGVTATKLSILCGIAKRGGTWRTYLGRLRGQGWCEGNNHCLRITPAGLQVLGNYDPLPTGPELIDYWRGELGDSGMRRIFDVLVEAYPQTLSTGEVCERTGIALAGGTWRTYIGKLRSLELVEGGRELRASETLFDA